MKRLLNISLFSGFTLVCLLAFQNCSQVAFTPDETASSAQTNGAAEDPNSAGTPGNDTNCRVDLISSTKNVKVLFLIDTSGSNQSNSNSLPGTDVGKVWRLATINAFISAYGSKPNFSFGFATFQNTSATSLMIADGHGVFSNNMTEINQAIIDFQNIRDQGYTPYDAALALAKDMISYDQQKANSKDVGYVVVMISDGKPTNASYVDPQNGMTNLSNDVKSIMNQVPGQISLNTVFLYNQDAPTASDKSYLQKIASLGSGSFIEASSQQTLPISDTVQVPKTVCN